MGVAHAGKIVAGFAHNSKKIAGIAHAGKVVYRSGTAAGSVLWTKPISSKILAIGAGNNLVAVATEDLAMTIYDGDGNLIGSGTFTGTPLSIEVFDTVSMATIEGIVYNYAIADGTVTSQNVNVKSKIVGYSRYNNFHYLFMGETAKTYHWDETNQEFVKDKFGLSNMQNLVDTNATYYAGYDTRSSSANVGSGLVTALGNADSNVNFKPISCYLNDNNRFFTFTDSKKFMNQQAQNSTSPGYDVWNNVDNTVSYIADKIYADSNSNVYAASYADGGLHKIASTGLPVKDWPIADSFNGFAVGKDVSETYVSVPDTNKIMKVFLK